MPANLERHNCPRPIEVINGLNCYDLICKHCGAFKVIGLAIDSTDAFECPGHCGAVYMQVLSDDGARLEQVVIPTAQFWVAPQ